MHRHYIDPDDLWMFAESIKNVKDIDGQKATDFIFLLYKADCGPISCEKLVAFRSAFWDKHAPSEGARYLQMLPLRTRATS